jgi:hypothetical protein
VESKRKLLERFDLLRSPIFLVSLFVLIANDHWWKYEYSSWLTGKLSDFAGLFVFAHYIVSFIHPKWRTSKILISVHIGIAFMFTIWKVAPVQSLLESMYGSLVLPLPTITSDVTDLIALTSLVISFLIIRYPSAETTHTIHVPTSVALKRFARVGLLVASTFAIVATSPPMYMYHNPSKYSDFNPNLDLESIAPIVKKVLKESGYIPTDSAHFSPGTMSYYFEGYFNWYRVDTTALNFMYRGNNVTARRIWGYVNVAIDTIKHQYRISTDLYSRAYMLESAKVKIEIDNRIHIPLWAAIREYERSVR